jgi:hypothetical protein
MLFNRMKRITIQQISTATIGTLRPRFASNNQM